MKYVCLITLMLCSAIAIAQQTLITGKVTAQQGVPLAGAMISGGGQTSTVGDDGSFSITAKLPVRLQAQHTGYTTVFITVDATTRLPITVVLQANNRDLEEVVISTGLQSLPKERVTGSFAYLSNKQLSRQVGTGIVQAMEGMVNALSFDKRSNRGQNISLSIRGRSTIFGDADPLVVLDGFAYEGFDLNTINPNDVENISFLKDAAAASIWGVKAANGVIVINTKKGRKDEPARLRLHSNITIGAEPDYSLLHTMSSADFIGVEEFLFGKGFYTSQENAAARPYLSPVVEILIKKRNGTMSVADADAAIAQLKQYDVRKDYNNYLCRQMVNRQHSVHINGGGPQLAYYLSAGMDDNTDATDAGYKRISLKSNNTYMPLKKLQLDVSVTYTQTTTASGKLKYNEIHSGGAKLLYPYARLADDNGNALATGREYRSVFIQGVGANGLLNWHYVPLEESKHARTNTIARDVLINTGLSYEVFKGFSTMLKYQYNANEYSSDNLNTQESYFTRDLINKYTQANTSGAITKRVVPLGSILNTANSHMQSYAIRAQINYAKQWNRHSVNLLAGSEVREREYNSAGNRTYGYNENTLTSVAVDHDSLYRLYHNNGTRLRVPTGNSSSSLLNRFRSVYFNGAYTYDNRYTVSISARKDGSNLFGVAANQKFVPLWSAGAAWHVSKEKYYAIKWLPDLKLRMSYGYSGNVDNGLTAYTTVIYSNGGLNNLPYAVLQTPPNPSLQWEQTAMLNIGVDFAIASKRIAGSIEYYTKKSDHLIGDAPVEPTTGVANGANQFVYRGNVAAMKGNGVDIELRTVNVKGRIAWNTTFLFNYNTNKVTEYLMPTASGSTYLNSGLGIYPAVDYPIYGIWSYRWAGLNNQGDPQGYYQGAAGTDWQNISTKTALDEMVFHGPGLPKFFGSVMNEVVAGKFSFSANIMYRLGHYFRRNGLSYNSLYNNWAGNGDFANRWQKPGDELHTHVPAMIYPNNTARDNFYINSQVLVEKADNIRVKDIRVNYDLPVRNNKILLKHLQCFVYANNVGMIWKATRTNIDPDILFEIPQPLTVTLGVKASF